MCDILIATPAATRKGVMLFAKNSDRDPNEAQVLERHPHRHPSEETLSLTYQSFPQAQETAAVLLSRPWWIWGAEMGANEYGLVAGNTAVFTRLRVPRRGLLGMDILRLALERCRSAEETMQFITQTIETYGQGGNCSYDHTFTYHNAFILADPQEAWVLETVDRHWVALKVKDVYSISNVLTIEDTWTRCSESVETLRKKHPGFRFASYFSDRLYTRVAHGRERRRFTYEQLLNHRGQIDREWMFRILQTHHTHPFSPRKASNRDICMHARSLLVPSQTASSQISLLTPTHQEHWFTGCSNPCLSLFKPLTFEGTWPEMGPPPRQVYTPGAYWWEMEVLHRRFHAAYEQYIDALQEERNALQTRWFQAPPPSPEAFAEERTWLKPWQKRLPTRPSEHSLFWRWQHKKAALF